MILWIVAETGECIHAPWTAESSVDVGVNKSATAGDCGTGDGECGDERLKPQGENMHSNIKNASATLAMVLMRSDFVSN